MDGLPETHMLAGAERLSEGRERIRPLTEEDVRRIAREEIDALLTRLARQYRGHGFVQ